MKVANIIAAGFIGIGVLVRFSYLIGDFTFWGLVECCFMVSFCIILFSSMGALGPRYGDLTRTYYNFLDNYFGTGSYMVFLCIMTLQKASKGEQLFPVIALVIGVINMLYGYNDTLKELPVLPWANWQDNRVKDEEDPKNKKKTAKELNEEKRKQELKKKVKERIEKAKKEDEEEEDEEEEEE